MTQDEMKKAAAWAALDYVKSDTIVGVGTGSTVNHFIDANKPWLLAKELNKKDKLHQVASLGLFAFRMTESGTVSVLRSPSGAVNSTV